jgi:Zn-dependent M28 family amino/carboxypeptidase
VFFSSLAIIAACALLRVIGFEATWLTIIQFIPTVVLIASCPLFVDVALSDPRGGRNDNASGVATVLRLAERHGGRLEHFDVMVVFTGGSAHFALGMRDWLKRHRADLEPEATAFISVDAVGAGTPHYATKEGPILASRLHPTLVELCAGDEAGAPFASRELSDAYAARAAGLPAIRISSRSDKGAEADEVDADALARSYDYLSGLVERIDSEIGPRLR